MKLAAWEFSRAAQLVKKASQSLPPQAANKVQSVFCRGVYLAENTSQAPSVEFAPRWGDKICTQETAKHLSKSLKEDF